MAAKTLVVSRIVASVQHMSGGSETNHRVAFVTRVDLLPGVNGTPLLLELELVEPSLFMDGMPEAGERFAAAVAGAVAGRADR